MNLYETNKYVNEKEILKKEIGKIQKKITIIENPISILEESIFILLFLIFFVFGSISILLILAHLIIGIFEIIFGGFSSGVNILFKNIFNSIIWFLSKIFVPTLIFLFVKYISKISASKKVLLKIDKIKSHHNDLMEKYLDRKSRYDLVSGTLVNSIIPSKYHTSYCMNKLIHIFECKRADKVSDLINIFEAEEYNLNKERTLEKIIKSNDKINKQLRKIRYKL